MNRDQLATLVAAHPVELDVAKSLSYGVRNSAQNAFDERSKANQLSWIIENNTPKNQFIVISPLFESSRNNTLFGNIREMLTACVPEVDEDQVHAFQDGEIWKDDEDDDMNLVIRSNKAGRSINQFLRLIDQEPTRLTKMLLFSKTKAGADDASNFSNDFKTMFFSPFDSPVEENFALSNLKNPVYLTQNQLTVDFIDNAFQVVLSNRHFFIFQVNANTHLTMNPSVGARDSQPERFWRMMNRRDDILRDNRIGK